MNTELANVEPRQLALQPANPVESMLRAVVEKGITADSVGAMEKLVELYERMQLRDAEKQFNAAFAALQSELPVIVATSIIPNRGKYEKFEDVMRVVQPLATKHGFSISFSMDFREGRVLETCHLRHIGGHSQANSFAVRTGKADSETQADCKAATTAKRNALLNCLNIVIRQDVFQDEDQNPANEGAPITPDKAIYLREQCAELAVDVPKFLAFAGAKAFDEISANRYDALVGMLAKKRAGGPKT